MLCLRRHGLFHKGGLKLSLFLFPLLRKLYDKFDDQYNNKNDNGPDNQIRQADDKSDDKVQNTFSYAVKAVDKAGTDLLPRTLFLDGSQLGHFIDLKIYGAVGNLIIISTKLGFHTFDLITHFGKAAFQSNDVFNGLHLFHQL